MKKYFALTLLSVSVLLFLVACNKNAVVVNNNNNNNNSNSLMPLKAGNIWIYQDSTWDSLHALPQVLTDTAYLSTATATSASEPGILFYNFVDYNGWFGPYAYFANASDQYGNSYLLAMDSIGTNPYTYFETAPSDGTLLGSSQDFSNPACLTTYQQFAFASTTVINGYTCYKNFITATNCNNVNVENQVEYVSPGVGIVRFEDWVQDTTLPNKPLYLNYSQTLTKYIPK